MKLLKTLLYAGLMLPIVFALVLAYVLAALVWILIWSALRLTGQATENLFIFYSDPDDGYLSA